MRFRAILFVSIAAALMAGDVQDRPARASDLPGIWQMVDLNTSVPAESRDSFFAPYQIFSFDRNGRMKHMTSPRPFSEGQLAVFNSAPAVTRYGIERRGTLVLTNPSWDVPRKYGCAVVTAAVETAGKTPPRVGDLKLTGTDEQGHLWLKLLRKIP